MLARSPVSPLTRREGAQGAQAQRRQQAACRLDDHRRLEHALLHDEGRHRPLILLHKLTTRLARVHWAEVVDERVVQRGAHGTAVLARLCHEKVGQVLHDEHRIARVRNGLLRVPLERVLLWVPLRAVHWVLDALHRGHKLLARAVVVGGQHVEETGQVGVVHEGGRRHPALVVVHGHILRLEDAQHLLRRVAKHARRLHVRAEVQRQRQVVRIEATDEHRVVAASAQNHERFEAQAGAPQRHVLPVVVRLQHQIKDGLRSLEEDGRRCQRSAAAGEEEPVQPLPHAADLVGVPEELDRHRAGTSTLYELDIRRSKVGDVRVVRLGLCQDSNHGTIIFCRSTANSGCQDENGGERMVH
mmetsp:Transcript_26630/g.85722  ORF Transcript_26630/g.85722 Transcript_26630/m.85722 type:complete len:358 (+) Transcript_26630:726-1799(+)